MQSLRAVTCADSTERATLEVAWMTTGRGEGSYGALEYTLREIDRGLPVRISVVFLNRTLGEAEPTDRLIRMLKDRCIPVETLSSVAFRKAHQGQRSAPGTPLPSWRYDYDEEIARLLSRHRFSMVILFGYMLIVTDRLNKRFTMLNDHPALPGGPVGTYQEVINKLIEDSSRLSGSMMNLATDDVDRGPPVTYCRFRIRDKFNECLWSNVKLSGSPEAKLALFDDIRRRGVLRERPFLVETLRRIASGMAVPPSGGPEDLTDQVEFHSVSAVADHFHTTIVELRGRTRQSASGDARAVAAWTLKVRGLPLTTIGQTLGGRKESTARYLASRGQHLSKGDSGVQRLVESYT